MDKKILVAVPYHEQKRYCLSALFDTLQSLTYKNKEIVLRFDPNEYGSKDSAKMQREFFRELALRKDFDYLYFFGADTIPPADVLERLLSHKTDIVGGVYFGRHNINIDGKGNSTNAIAWINSILKAEADDIFSDPTKGLVEIDGMGMDCVLISREVLERISYMSWGQNDDDYPFYEKAQELDYKVYIDTTIQCKHYFHTGEYVHCGSILKDN